MPEIPSAIFETQKAGLSTHILEKLKTKSGNVDLGWQHRINMPNIGTMNFLGKNDIIFKNKAQLDPQAELLK